MNSKQKNKTIATTLAVATAISAATTLPVNLVQQVQAQDDSEINQSPVEPTKKIELKEQLDKANADVIATSTALEGAKLDRTDALIPYNQAKDDLNANDTTMNDISESMNTTLSFELNERYVNYQKIQSDLQTAQDRLTDVQSKVKEKQSQLDEAQEKYDAMIKELEKDDSYKENQEKLKELQAQQKELQNEIDSLNSQKEENEKSIKNLTAQKESAEMELKKANESIEGLNTQKESLKSQLTDAQTKLDNIKSALSENGNTEEITKLQNEVTQLEGEVSSLNSKINDLNQKIEQKSKEVNDKQKKFDEIESKLEAAEAEEKAAYDIVAEKRATYDKTSKEYEELFQKYKSIQEGNYPDDLKQLKQELADLQALEAELQNNCKTLETAAAEAQKAFDESAENLNNNVASFMQYVYDNTDDENVKYDISLALQALKDYDGKLINVSENTNGLKYYDSKNYENTPFELSNFIKSLDYLKVCNAIREREGSEKLKFSFYLTVISAIQNQQSSLHIGHSKLFNVGENLAWYPIINSKQYFNDDGSIDLDRMETIGRENKQEDDDYYNPFVGWWIEEKMLKEQGSTDFNEIGHYENIINKNYTITGFSVNSSKNNKYGYTFSQVFSYTDSIKGNSIDDIEALVSNWLSYKDSKKSELKENADKTSQAFNDAKTSLATVQGQITAKQNEIDSYMNNLIAQRDAASKAWSEASDEISKADSYALSKAAVTRGLKEQKQIVQTDLNTLNYALINLRLDKNDTEKTLSSTNDELLEKRTKLANISKNREELLKEYNEALSDVEQLETQLDSLTKDIESVNTNITKLTSNIESLSNQINSKNNEQSNINVALSQNQEKVENNAEQIKKYEDAIKQYESTNKELENLHNTIIDLNHDLALARADMDNAQEWVDTYTRWLAASQQKIDNRNLAEKQWQEIKNGTSNEFGPFENDDILNELTPKVQEYINAQSKVQALTEAYNQAKQKFDEADAKYSKAYEADEDANARLEAASNAYNIFVSTHGNVSSNTITVAEKVLYTGEEVRPTVVVKDSLGNTIDSSEYIVTYSNNIELGTASVTIKMNGENYVGEFIKSFEIVKELPKEDQKPSNPGNTGNNENTGNSSNTGNASSSNTNTANTSSTKDTKSNKGVVKTGDETPIVGFGVMAMLSSALFFFTKSKKEEQ